jgi:hypothetical protein
MNNFSRSADHPQHALLQVYRFIIRTPFSVNRILQSQQAALSRDNPYLSHPAIFHLSNIRQSHTIALASEGIELTGFLFVVKFIKASIEHDEQYEQEQKDIE